MGFRNTCCLIALLLFSFMKAQVVLPYSINNAFTADDSAAIDPVSTYSDSSNLFVASGFQVGDTVPDFTLPDTAYTNVQLSAVLNQGKPVMLITISYSCPISRQGLLTVLPDLVNVFGNDVNFVLVYVVEAHPVYPDWSPYFDTVNTTTENFTDSILLRQETQYYKRKCYACTVNHAYHPAATVLLDDYQNNYWHNFGPAPNNAYLLTPSGRVYKKYGWFADNEGLEFHDISQLLAIIQDVNETTITDHVKVFPVPAASITTIQTDFGKEWTLDVTDETGRVIRHIEKITAADYQLDCSELQRGIYFINAYDEDHSVRLSLVAGN